MANSSVFFNKLNEQVGTGINCCIIGIVESYNSTKNTLSVIPTNSNLPILTEVPLMTFGTKEFNIKFKINKNDMVLVLFIDYDIDNLLIDGVTQELATERTHSINDRIALPMWFNPLKSQYEGSIFLQINAENDIEFKFNNKIIKASEIISKLEKHEIDIADLEERVTRLERGGS